MALITVTIAVQAAPASVQVLTGSQWPPVQPLAIDDPSGEDPQGVYPVIDLVESIELLNATDPVTSPENRVTEYLDSRTETLRALANLLAQLMNLLPYYFVDRDGDALKRDLDMGGFKIIDLADAVDPGDLITVAQLEATEFEAQDVDDELATEVLKLDGSVSMTGDLDMGGGRVFASTIATLSTDLMRRGEFDANLAAGQALLLSNTGVPGMTGDLSFQDQPTSPRFRPRSVGYPTGSNNLCNRFFLEEQFALATTSSLPVGALMPFCGAEDQIPTHFLLCDGREVSRTTYAALYAVVTVLFGTPSNNVVFRLPDLRGRVLTGADGLGTSQDAHLAHRLTDPFSNLLGGKFGEETHALTVGEIPAHTHTYDDAQAASGVAGALQGAVATDSNNTVASTPRVTGSTGGAAHNNIQPVIALNWLIRF